MVLVLPPAVANEVNPSCLPMSQSDSWPLLTLLGRTGCRHALLLGSTVLLGCRVLLSSAVLLGSTALLGAAACSCALLCSPGRPCALLCRIACPHALVVVASFALGMLSCAQEPVLGPELAGFHVLAC
jgi:hypothetical protein